MLMYSLSTSGSRKDPGGRPTIVCSAATYIIDSPIWITGTPLKNRKDVIHVNIAYQQQNLHLLIGVLKENRQAKQKTFRRIFTPMMACGRAFLPHCVVCLYLEHCVRSITYVRPIYNFYDVLKNCVIIGIAHHVGTVRRGAQYRVSDD